MMFSIGSFILENPLLFIVAVFVLSISIILKSGKMFSLEVLLLLVMSVGDMMASPVFQAVFSTLQLILFLFLLYKLFQAINYNYQLIMEKTHQVPVKIVKNGYNGTKKTFL